MDKHTKNMGQLIKRLRKAKGWTQAEVAAMIDTDATNIGRVERGLQHLSLQRLYALCGALQISPADLFSDSDPASGTPHQVHQVPVIGAIKVEAWDRIECVEGTIDCSERIERHLGVVQFSAPATMSSLVAVSIAGTGVVGVAQAGEVVVLEHSTTCKPGDLVLIRIKSTGARSFGTFLTEFNGNANILKPDGSAAVIPSGDFEVQCVAIAVLKTGFVRRHAFIRSGDLREASAK